MKEQARNTEVQINEGCCCCCCYVALVVSDSVRPCTQQPTRLLRPWDSPGKNAGVGCHFLLQCLRVKSESEVAQSCPTLHDPMDCSLPGSSIHGNSQARVLEWIAIAFSINEGKLPEKEFRIMIVKMIKNLENMKKKENMQDQFKKT